MSSSAPFRKTNVTLAVIVGFALTGCGGGGGGGGDSGETVTGLDMPTKLSVVAAQDDATAAGVFSGVTTTQTFDPSSDYESDPSQTWVWDPSMEGLDMVNEILCYVQQTGAKEMVNQGPYVALINEKKCQQGQNQSQASSGGAQSSSSSSAQQTSYARWVIESSRADSSSPQRVNIWVPSSGSSDDPMDNQRILVETTITEGVSASNPFGEFTLNFKGVMPKTELEAMVGSTLPPGSPDEIPMMMGTLETVGSNQFTYIDLGGRAMADADPDNAAMYSQMPFEMRQSSNVQFADASGASGEAVTAFSEWFDENGNGTKDVSGDWSETSEFAVAFQGDYFLRGKDSDGSGDIDVTDAQACSNRTNYNTQTWRYNLYYESAGTSPGGDSVTAGQRVKLNSGFPVTYDDSGVKRHGHVGYWGVWLEDQDSVSASDLDGISVTKEVFGPDAGSAPSYTVNVSGGKLWKRTRQEANYNKLIGAGLNWWGDPSDPFCSSGCLNQNDYRVKVNAAGDGIEVVGLINWTDFGPEVDTSVTEAGTSIYDTATASSGQQLWMWSDTLGGNVVVKASGVTFFKEEIVSPADIPAGGLDLVCYERCINGGLTSAATEGDLFSILWNDGLTSPVTYTVTANGTIAMKEDASGNDVVIDFDTSGLTDGSGNPVDWYQWGVDTGEMVTAADDTAYVTNPWDIYEDPNITTTYRWETGSNDWNRQISLTDGAGDVVNFDKPLQLTYEYANGDDPNVDAVNHPAGNTFMLEYGGPGELWGFPWEPEPGCDLNADDCRWISALTLKKGVVLSDDGGTNYVVKPIESEQSMVEEAGTASCTAEGLNVTDITLTPPTAVSGAVSITLADKPTVTDAPAVIEGEVQ